ncbi:hypothetical protein [Streptosporangium roseum]|uniref:hypothetical protein n=1 Tax=Streptosporangium roseum TaxID=2001 RepID=UPI0033249C39
MEKTLYLRFQGTSPNRWGRFPGVFGLVNGLALAGKLTEGQKQFWRTNHDWYDANFTNPSETDPTVYDRSLNPGAAAWFKPSAHMFIERVAGYMEILAAHGVGCEARYSSNPGRIVYEDDHQIVVVPHQDGVTAP